jgi:class 3 adenylate cyclase/predicted ATPase
MQDVTRWLESLGLDKYAEVFAENAVGLDILHQLKEKHLKELGVLLGDRLRLLEAIKTLDSAPTTISPEAVPTSTPVPVIPTTRLTGEAQRRQLTVMFCDLVDSTALSSQLDPEDMREVITSFQDTAREGIQQYAGFIARYMGDGILVYFGYPQAHEDDAERAVRAGLAIVQSMAQPNTDITKQYGVELAVRVGVATGPVVVGDIIGEGAAEEAAVIGETPNLAARLQNLAAPNQVTVAPATYQLLGALFEYEDLGAHQVKGIDQPIQVWRVVGERDVDSRYEATRMGSGLPLVGRQEELGLLTRSWEATKQGHGQVVLIQGEGGIGKSRLLEALREQIHGEDYIWVAHRCSPYHINSPLYPIIEHMKRVIGWKPEDDTERKLEKLEAALGRQSLPLDEAVPLYAELMSLPLPQGRYAPLELTALQQREQTLDALAGWLLEEAERTPVLNAWEDLHWVDPTTLELLGLYIEQSPTVSMLNVLTYRPEFVAPWSMHSHMTPITLNRLERPEVEAMIAHHATQKLVPAEVVEHIVVKADGVPLYVEELTKTILQSEFLYDEGDGYTLAGSLSELAIPATLQDSLMARLDRVPTAREVAQLGAVFGREFTYEMLQSLAPHEEPILQDGLGQLVDSELLYQRGRGRRARYVFKHALIQDAAYESLLKRTRQQYHQRVAELMQEKLPETEEMQPELLAHHYSEAGSHAKAIEYWRAAGRRAAERSANAESIAHLKHGLDNIQMLPDTPERVRLELEFLTDLGPALIASLGYGAEEVKDTYERAKVLCDQIGNKRDLFPVLRGLWNSYLFAAEMPEALKRGKELLHLAEDIGDSSLVVEAHRVMGTVSFVMGDFVNAQRFAERGVELYDPEQHRDLAFVYGADPAVVCRLYGAKALWMLGYPARAQAMMNAALSRVHEFPHGHTEAFAFCYQATLRQYRREAQLTYDSAEAAVKVASEHGIRQWLAWGTILGGWALVFMGKQDKGIKRLQEGLDNWRAKDLFSVPYLLGLKAEALAALGQVDEGVETLATAIEVSEKCSQRFYLAELYRLKGELLLMLSKDNHTDTATCFQQAVDVARDQQAKSLELRAVMSLGRMCQQQGKGDSTYKELKEIYGWFSEGFDTDDLHEAKTLADALS